jgi:3-phosphoshikimate 1-carboxyvinyltransferase
MAQTLAVVALFAKGTTQLTGLQSLRVKETDRVAALAKELTKLGASVIVQGDDLIIDPPHKLRPAAIDTYDDHRMAMSFAVAGTAIDGVVINDPQCVNKTYPNFFADLARLG